VFVQPLADLGGGWVNVGVVGEHVHGAGHLGAVAAQGHVELFRAVGGGGGVEDVDAGAAQKLGDDVGEGVGAVGSVDASLGAAALNHQVGGIDDGAEDLVEAGVVGGDGKLSIFEKYGGALGVVRGGRAGDGGGRRRGDGRGRCGWSGGKCGGGRGGLWCVAGGSRVLRGSLHGSGEVVLLGESRGREKQEGGAGEGGAERTGW